MTVGLIRAGLGRSIGIIEGVRIVAVDVEHMPAEAVPLGVHRLHILDDGHGVDELQTVAVDDETDIVQMVLTGKGRRFPDLSLLLLTVAE